MASSSESADMPPPPPRPPRSGNAKKRNREEDDDDEDERTPAKVQREDDESKEEISPSASAASSSAEELNDMKKIEEFEYFSVVMIWSVFRSFVLDQIFLVDALRPSLFCISFSLMTLCSLRFFHRRLSSSPGSCRNDWCARSKKLSSPFRRCRFWFWCWCRLSCGSCFKRRQFQLQFKSEF